MAVDQQLLQQLMMQPGSSTGQTNGMLQQMASTYGGASAIPMVQRSQYLADALQNLTKQGTESKSWGALGANLLADALLQFQRNKSNKDLLGAVQSGQGNMLNASMRGTGLPGDPDAAQPQEAPSAPPPAPPPPEPSNAPTQPVPQAPIAPASMSNVDPQTKDLLTRLLVGEASKDPADQAATASVVLNRANQSGKSIPDIIGAPHQFEAYDNPTTWARLKALDPTNPAYQQAAGVANNVLTNGPTGSWDHFYSPSAQAALGRQPPAWDNGAGQMIGQQKYFTLNGQGTPTQSANGYAVPPPPPMQQLGNAPSGPPPMMPAGGPPQGSPLPGMAPQGAPPMPPTNPPPLPQSAPPAPPMPPMGAQQPQMQQGPPTGLKATPQEAAFIQDRLRYPAGSAMWQQGLEKMQEIQQRAISPLAPPTGYRWGPNGQAISETPFTDVNGPAGTIAQRGPDNQLHIQADPSHGAIPEGYQLTPNGLQPLGASAQGGQPGPNAPPAQGLSVAPRPMTDLKERAAWGIPASDHNAYMMTLKGPVKSADAPFGPKDLQTVHDNFWGSDETKKSQEGYSAYTGLTNALQNATGNNGPLDQAALDSFLRGINPGMGARNSTVQMVMSHFGLPAEIQGKIMSLTGGGFITPQSLQQMLQVTHDYALAHQQAAAARAQQDAQLVSPYGYGPSDLAESLPPIGALPKINFGGGGAPGLPHVTPQQAAQLPKGSHFIGQDGIERVRQ